MFSHILCLLFLTSIAHSAPVKNPSDNSTCTPEKIEKIADCVKDLVFTVESITKWVDQDYKFTESQKTGFKKSCDDIQTCFSTVATACPDFPKAVAMELDVMCSRFTFVIDKFADCAPKLDKLLETKCVNELFGPASLKRSSAEKCENIEKHRKCARKEVDGVCGAKMGEIMDENFDQDLKMFNCSATVAN